MDDKLHGFVWSTANKWSLLLVFILTVLVCCCNINNKNNIYWN